MTWWLDVSCHYSYVRFCIDSENAFNMLPSRVILDVTSCHDSAKETPAKAAQWVLSDISWRQVHSWRLYSKWNLTNSEQIRGSLYRRLCGAKLENQVEVRQGLSSDHRSTKWSSKWYQGSEHHWTWNNKQLACNVLWNTGKAHVKNHAYWSCWSNI